MKLSKKLATTTLAMVIAVGGGTAAFATSGPDGESTHRHRPTVEQICNNQEQIITRLTQRQTNLTERIARLNEKRSAVTDEAILARIDARLAQLQKYLDRVTARLEGAPAWIAEHCV